MTQRLNKYIANATGLARREADEAISAGRVLVNGLPVNLGQRVGENDTVKLDGHEIESQPLVYLLLNKPIGYVSSRKSQDDKLTLYSLLPEKYHSLKPAGRLDADSRGLILLTNDGDYAQELTHPRSQKTKTYETKLDRELDDHDLARIESGVPLEDGLSKLGIERRGSTLIVTMHEGRNRQIRRTFTALDYTVVDLFRTQFGPYTLEDLSDKEYNEVSKH